MLKMPYFTPFFLNLFNFTVFKTVFCLTIFYLIDKGAMKMPRNYNFACVLRRKRAYAYATSLCDKTHKV